MDEQITLEKIKARISESLSAELGQSAIKMQQQSLSQASEPTGSVVQASQPIESVVQASQQMAFKGRINTFLWKYGGQHARIIKKIPVLAQLFQMMEGRQAASEKKLMGLLEQAVSSINERNEILQQAVSSINERNEILQQSVSFIYERDEKLEQAVSSINERNEILQQSVSFIYERDEKLEQAVSSINERNEILQQAVSSINERNEKLEQGIDAPAVFVTKGQIDSDSYLSLALKSSASSLAELKSNNKDEDVFYYLLENLFRGSMENIKSRQSVYLPYVVEAQAKSKGKLFIDLGCGRGEFLSLLQGQCIAARGVDSNGLMKELLAQQGLDFSQADALEYLQGQKNSLLTGISMFQVIEHLDFKYMNTILKLAFTKISQSGIIILESINPYCFAAKGSYYLDPTHVTLYSPDTIKFILEWNGFSNIKIVYSSPVSMGLRQREPIMNYQTYAVIGEKA